MKEEEINAILESNKFNEIIQEDIEIDNKISIESLKTDIQSNMEILNRKREGLNKAIKELKEVCVYGELNQEIAKLNESLEDVDFDINQLKNDLKELKI